MKVTWLGQAGFYIQTKDQTIMVDPYLTNSIGQKKADKNRRMPENALVFEWPLAMLICTHDHIDHLDSATVDILLEKHADMKLFGPSSCWKCFREKTMAHNTVLFDVGTQWTEGQTRITAVKAVHSDAYAIGVVIEDGEQRIYISGDTLYHPDVLAGIENMSFDGVFVPINGAGNNMNGADAKRFVEQLEYRKVYPCHWGMFDSLDPAKLFFAKNAEIMEIYRTFEI